MASFSMYGVRQVSRVALTSHLSVVSHDSTVCLDFFGLLVG